MTVRALSTYQAKRFWAYLHNRADERTANPSYGERITRKHLLRVELEEYRRLLDTFSACFRHPIRSVDDVRAMGGRQTAAFLRSLNQDIAGLHKLLKQNERLHEQALANPTESPQPASAYEEIAVQLEFRLSILEGLRVSLDWRIDDF